MATLQRVGSYLWWEIADARITRSKLASLLRDNKLMPAADWLPPEIVAHAAFRKAVAAADQGNRSQLIRLAEETPDEIVYAVVREHGADPGQLGYETRAQIVLKKRTGKLVLRGSSAAGDVARRLYADYLTTYTAVDLRRWLTRLITDRLRGVAAKDSGGVYYLPQRSTARLRRLAKAVEGFPGSPTVTISPIYASPETTRSVGRVVADALSRDVEAIYYDLVPPDGKLPRLDKLDRRAAACAELSEKIRIHASDLKFDAEYLHINIHRIVDRIAELRVLVEEQNERKAEQRKAKRRVGYRKPARIMRKTRDPK